MITVAQRGANPGGVIYCLGLKSKLKLSFDPTAVVKGKSRGDFLSRRGIAARFCVNKALL